MLEDGQPETGKDTGKAPQGKDSSVQPTDPKAPADQGGLDNGTVYDLKDVPPELKPTLEYHQKRMQAEHTRRTQKISEREKSMGSIETKAKAWDNALQLPSVMRELRKAAGQTPESQDSPEQPGKIETVDELLAASKRSAREAADAVLARLEPVLNGLRQENKDLRRRMVSKELPEFDKYRDDIDSILQAKPNLSEEEAYILASHSDQVLNAERRALDGRREEARTALASQTESEDTPLGVTDELLASIASGTSMADIDRRLAQSSRR